MVWYGYFFSDRQYYDCYAAGLSKKLQPQLKPKFRVLPAIYDSIYRYTQADMNFAYYQGFWRNPRPRRKKW